MSSAKSADSREARLEQVLAEYLHSVELGTPLDEQSLLAKHPDLADDLRSFFRNRSEISRLARPLQSATDDAATVALGTSKPVGAKGEADGFRVRYFGDYELLEEIARGGMGVVYKARQVSLNRLVALKMILAGQLAAADDVKRFQQEAESAANLDHSGIVPIYEIGEHDGQHYFSMKLIEGHSLSAELREHRATMAPTRSAELIAQVARAVHHAHQRGVLHRDLKPGNILLDSEGVPHVTDFGLAKRVEGQSDLTQTGAIVGTPAYMAPEQAHGEKQLSTAADVYSLGAILYELLVGRAPFRGDSPLETLLKVMNSEPERPSSISKGLDPDLETICLKCLEKEPERRYDSAAALADDLDRWLRGEPIEARASTWFETAAKWARRHPAAAALTAVSFASLLFFVAGLVWALRQEQDRFVAERGLRIRAEQAETDEKAASLAAKKSAEQATIAERKSNDRLIRLYTRDGVERMEAGDYLVAMSWFAEALAVEQEEGPRSRAQRIRLGTLLRATPRLVHTGVGSGFIMAVSADGTRIATADDKTARVWDAVTGKPLSPPLVHEHPIWTLALSPDGGRLATTTQPARAMLWDVAGGKPIRGPLASDKTDETAKVQFSPSGKELFVAVGPRAEIWNAATGARVGEPLVHEESILYVRFDAAGDRFATASGHQVRIWKTADATPITPFLVPRLYSRQMEFSSDGARLLVYSGARESWCIEVYDAKAGQRLFEPLGQDFDSIGHCYFVDPAGKFVGTDRLLWNVETGKEVQIPNWPQQGVVMSARSADGKLLATSGADRLVRLWDVEQKKPRAMPISLPQPASQLLFLDADRRLLTVAGNEVRLWNTESGEPLTPPLRSALPIASVGTSADGRRISLVTQQRDVPSQWRSWELADEPARVAVDEPKAPTLDLSDDGSLVLVQRGLEPPLELQVVEAKGGTTISKLTLERAVSWLQFAPGGKYFFGMVEDRGTEAKPKDPPDYSVRVWESRTGKLVGQPIKLPGYRGRILFYGQGPWISTIRDESELELWDPATGGAASSPLPAGQKLISAEWSRDGRLMFTWSPWHQPVLRIWEATSGKPVGVPISLDPDGYSYYYLSQDATGRVAVGFRAPALSLIDVETGKTLAPLIELRGRSIMQTAFSADGRRLAVVSREVDRTSPEMQIRLFEVPSGKPLGGARRYPDGLNDIRLSPNGEVLAVIGYKWMQFLETETGFSVAPPALAHDSARAQFSADGAEFVWTENFTQVYRLSLVAETRSAKVLQQLARCLSGHRIDASGTIVPVISSEEE